MHFQLKINRHIRANIAIEMAFSLPLFLMVLLATIEINRYLWTGYLLDHNLHQAIKSEAWNPGIGVEERLKSSFQALIDPNKLIITNNTQAVGNLLINEYQVSYQTRFLFLPNTELTFHSSSWLGDNENDIK